MKRVIVIGELNVDLIVTGLSALPELGKEIVCTGLSRELGSSSAIFARALAGLGAQVGFMGKVGDDENGRFMLSQLRELAIETSEVIVDPGTQTGITISLTYPGEKAQITHPGSIADYCLEEVRQDALSGYGHLHMASMFLQRGLRAGIPHLLRKAKAFGMSTSLDPGWDPEDRWGNDLIEAIRNADVLFLNEHESKAIAGRGEEPADEALRQVGALLSPGAVTLCKLGGGGAMMYADGELLKIAAHRVPVVDTTGAGDSFDAGFIFSAIVRGRPPFEALRFANACGAIAVTRVGGASAVPSAQDVDEFLQAGEQIAELRRA